jgi:signal transduction histidine kinase
MSVIDSGTGIAPEYREAIFDPFFSIKGTDGTGLALSICRDIVLAHHGSISVDSMPGAGSRFTIWLPASGERIRVAEAKAPIMPPPGRVLR